MQGFKKRVKSKGGAAHTARKTKTFKKKAKDHKAKSHQKLQKEINNSIESQMIEKAKQSKIRIKIAGPRK